MPLSISSSSTSCELYRVYRKLLIIFLLLLILAPTTSKQTSAEENSAKKQYIDLSHLARSLAKNAKFNAVEIDFQESRKFSFLRKVQTQSGKLWFDKNGNMRWQLGSPPKQVFIKQAEKIFLINKKKGASKKSVIELSINELSTQKKYLPLLSIMQSRPRTLTDFKKHYAIHASKFEKNIQIISAFPLDENLRRRIKTFDFVIDTQKDELRSVCVNLQNDSVIKTTFTKIKELPNINKELLEVKVR